jgi:hypothetical protein
MPRFRDELRCHWHGPGELVWVEAARGGTVGAPRRIYDTPFNLTPVRCSWLARPNSTVSIGGRARRFCRNTHTR